MRATRRQCAILAGLILLASCGGGGGGSPTSPAPGATTPTTPPAPTAPTTPAASEVIATSSNSFNPTSLTVARGTTVTFTFQSVIHNVTFANVTGAPANIANTSNSAVTRTFSTVGTFGYDCTLHPGMTGTVVVN
jgi:plastocyanin